jgi:hypothetical protein
VLGIRQRLQNAMAVVFAVTSVFKLDADLSSVTGDVGNLCKDFSKDDQVVIVGGGGRKQFG